MPDLLLSHILNYGKFSAARNDYRADMEFLEVNRIAKQNNETTANTIGRATAFYGTYMRRHDFDNAANQITYIKELIKE